MKHFIPYQLKIFIKKYFWKFYFYNKIFAPAVKLNNDFVENNFTTTPDNFNVFTTHGEDGILLYLINKIAAANKKFIDIGSNDCINSNCANLAFHHNWQGLFIDADKTALNRGEYIYRHYFKKDVSRFSFLLSLVTPENINEILSTTGFDNGIDLVAMDLDGNDYYIWDAIKIISPSIVLVEVQVEKGNVDYIPDYSKSFEAFEDDNPKGASPLSMKKLATKKGYTYVTENRGGYNLFFVRNDLYEKYLSSP